MGYNQQNLPLVVLFGRTNVGKSTLFNCITEEKKALVSKQEGTTRDSNLGEVAWGGAIFLLVDTGGITDVAPAPAGSRRETAANDIDLKVQRQAREYLKRADLILYLVDARDGLLPQDRAIARGLKKAGIPAGRILLVANKTDSPALRRDLAEFNKLAMGEPIPVSATTGSGTGDLLDLITAKITVVPAKPEAGPREETDSQTETLPAEDVITVGIIGKPNVGKSSLIN
jgi:GTP-binding protein